MIVFLACCKTKNNKECKAKDMYQGALFKYSYQYALTLNASHIYILSAKYGLLELDEKIVPYNKTLVTMKKQEQKLWAINVYKQMKNKNINFNEKALFLCGEKYRFYLMQLFPNAECPFENYNGLGYQLQFLKNKLKGV